MKLRTFFLSTIFFLSCLSAFGQKVQTIDGLLGDWFGESKCAGNNPSCHDEVVVYHLTRSKVDPAKINLAADKIVDGKPDPMGEFEMDYDAAKQTLAVEFKIPRTGGKGVWLFKVDGDKIEGTLTVFPENEVGRIVKVSRTKPETKQ